MAKRDGVLPGQVLSPMRRWSLVDVLLDEGDGEPAVAAGRWEGEPVLAMRWNGDADNRIGNPQSRGLPVWFVVPATFEEAILKRIEELVPDKRPLIRSFFQNPGQK